ncbi:MAG: LysM peptidoglycan-binding domain-containing protein [Anaerolineae bacterium]
MKRLLVTKFYLLILVFTALSIGFWPVHAQGQNLLTNPGFEQPFTSVSGNPPRQVAQGWSPWNISGGQSASENVQPEYYPASDVSNGLGVPRIRNGSDAQQYHSFFATHDGGLFQRVTGVNNGAQLRFSAYLYVWSSTFDDPNKSEDPGGIVVQVGIDPMGGTDGTSNAVVWSAPSIQYDAYNEYIVTATAASSAVTVFVRSTVTTPVKNNNLYVDDASLTLASGTSATNTSIPPTSTKAATATSTPIPPTATSTTAPPPTSEVVASATTAPANTAVGATATSTQISPSSTSVPPSSTNAPTATTPLQPTPTQSGSGSIGEFPGRVVHIVQPGDTVGVLATIYGSTTDAIIDANGLTPSALIRVGQGLVIPVRLSAPATSTPTVTPIAPSEATSAPNTGSSSTSYVVQPGDTLGRIAARYNTTIATLAQLNGITNLNIIYVGQRLTLPTSTSEQPSAPVVATATPTPPVQTTYVVRVGDTLFRIALRFNVSMGTLAQANGITNVNRVFVGQVLVIP